MIITVRHVSKLIAYIRRAVYKNNCYFRNVVMKSSSSVCYRIYQSFGSFCFFSRYYTAQTLIAAPFRFRDGSNNGKIFHIFLYFSVTFFSQFFFLYFLQYFSQLLQCCLLYTIRYDYYWIKIIVCHPVLFLDFGSNNRSVYTLKKLQLIFCIV